MRLKNYINEGKVTFFNISKLKYFSTGTLKKLLNSDDFINKRVTMDKDMVGGTQKDTRLFIKELIKQDKEATKELGISITKDQKYDWKYLKGI